MVCYFNERWAVYHIAQQKLLNTFWEIFKDIIFILFRHPDDFIMERNKIEQLEDRIEELESKLEEINEVLGLDNHEEEDYNNDDLCDDCYDDYGNGDNDV